MTINNALRRFHRPSRGPKAARRPEPLAVGEVDTHVFNCPRCTRPLATGAPVCPGCGTRLIFGVRARLALSFLVVGVSIGTLLGGGIMYAARPAGPSAALIDPGDDGTVPGVVVASPSAEPLTPREVGIPSKAVSALRQAAILDARMSAQGAKLKTLMKNKNAKGIDIARILRTLNTDATFGVDLAPTIAPWTDAAKLSYDLGSFYRAVRDSSQASLRASVSDDKAYRAAGKRMVTLLAKLPALDATAAALVADAGLAPLFEPVPTAPAVSAAP